MNECPNESFNCSNESFIYSNDLLIRPMEEFFFSFGLSTPPYKPTHEVRSIDHEARVA